MKPLVSLFLCLVLSVPFKTTPMIELLKTHIQNKDTDTLIRFIRENPDVLEQTDTNGSSGLLLIAYSGLEAAFETAIATKKTFTFHEAIVCGKLEIVMHYITEDSSDIINRYSSDGFTPLALASFFNRTPVAKFLAQKGADPNLSATNPSKVNALHAAVAKENMELCVLFIEMGANVNATQTQGVTPLHSAVHRGNLQLTQLLVTHGALIELQMDNGNTALSIAQAENHNAIARYLLEKKD